MAGSDDEAFSAETLIDRAGLRGMDKILTGLAPDPDRLAAAIDQAETLIGDPHQ